MTLDGRIAHADRRAHLSSPEGHAHARALRRAHDAVLVGAGTVRCDDPALRCPENESFQAVVLVGGKPWPLGSALEQHPRLLTVVADGCTMQVAGRTLVVAADAASPDRPCISAALAALRAAGIERLLVEGGRAVLTSLFRARAVDRFSAELAPHFFGAPALGLLGDLGIGSLDAAPALENVVVDRLGPHVLLAGDVRF
jgi:diaminohydroxyphosphoribosylaminopyrimidine deaminase/5-amino-6-(5-phosphoribosylamino)uracil reductase